MSPPTPIPVASCSRRTSGTRTTIRARRSPSSRWPRSAASSGWTRCSSTRATSISHRRARPRPQVRRSRSSRATTTVLVSPIHRASARSSRRETRAQGTRCASWHSRDDAPNAGNSCVWRSARCLLSAPAMQFRTKVTTSALVAVLAMACGSTVETIQDSNTGGSTAGNAAGGSGNASGGATTAAGGSGGAAVTTDMFACGVPNDCVQNHGHLGRGITEEALRCGGELVASGEPGAVLSTSQPGPYPTSVETLVVLRGDGTLFQQTRTRCATDTDCGDQNTTAWKLMPLEVCDVEVDPADIAGCGEPNGMCEWLAYGVNCAPVSRDWTCAELP